MAKADDRELSRREREMMDVIYRRREATAAEVRDGLAEPPSYSAVRATLRILEEKGQLVHRREGTRYVYRPKRPRLQARRSALSRLLRTFFDDSPEQAVAALLEHGREGLTEQELDRLSELIEKAKKEGR